MKTVLNVIFIFIIPLFSQDYIKLKDVSSFKAEPYSDQMVSNSIKFTSTNIAYRIPLGWNTDFVIKETIKIEKIQGYEGNSSHINLVAYSISEKNKVLWEINNTSDNVFYHWMDFIETIKYGCCGATDYHTFYDLKNGNKILSCDNDFIYIRNRSENLERFLGFNSYSSVYPPPNTFGKNKLTGELFFSDRNSIIDSILFIFPEEDIFAWPPDSIFLIDNFGNKYFGKKYYNHIRTIELDKQIEGLRIVIHFPLTEPIYLLIENNKINLSKSIIPKNIIVDNQDGIYYPEYLNSPEYKSLNKKSKKQLRLLRNEIFARNGYSFKSKELRAYFQTKDWYKEIPGKKIDFESLTNDEKLFLLKIQNLEKR